MVAVKTGPLVIPAKAGIQQVPTRSLDSRVRGYDADPISSDSSRLGLLVSAFLDSFHFPGIRRRFSLSSWTIEAERLASSRRPMARYEVTIRA